MSNSQITIETNARKFNCYLPGFSEALQASVASALTSGTLTSFAGARAVFSSLSPHEQYEIICAGLRQVIRLLGHGATAEIRLRRLGQERARTHKISKDIRNMRSAFSKIVEVLDTRYIGERALGDCKRSDLLREAHRLETEAGEMTLDATLYRQLAAMVGDRTVRAAEGRDKVIGLLTARWGDDVLLNIQENLNTKRLAPMRRLQHSATA